MGGGYSRSLVTPLRILFHVSYVTPDEPSPDPLGFVLSVLRQPVDDAILIVAAIVVLGLAIALVRSPRSSRHWERFVRQATTYRHFVPWMLRLSAGLVLIGAGLGGYLFAPDLHLAGWPYFGFTVVGFLLLLGLAVRPAALIALGGYALAMILEPHVLLIADVGGALAAIALVGPGVPSLDDLLRAAFPRAPGAQAATTPPSQSRYDDLLPLTVRLGLGAAFLVSGIADKFLIYERSLEAVAKYHLTSVIPVDAGLWVVGAGLAEAALGVAILLGFATRISAIVAFAVLTLSLFALPDDAVVAHVALFGLCSVLVVLGAGRWSLDAWLERRRAAGGRPVVVDQIAKTSVPSIAPGRRRAMVTDAVRLSGCPAPLRTPGTAVRRHGRRRP